MYLTECKWVNRVLVAVCLLAFVGVGCDKKEESVSGNAPSGQLGKAPGSPAAPPMATGISGEVLTTMDSGGYTYVEVKTQTGNIWAAGPKMDVKVGESVLIPPGSNVMKDFESKTLNRKFETIYFVGAITKLDGKGQPSGLGVSADSVNSAHASQKAAPAQTVKAGSIAKVDGGYTLEELVTRKESLKGKKVKIRGKVMKFNPGIMGKNWVHIQDGTEKGDQKDLTITTKDTVENGAIVVAEGSLSVDKDVGGGYFYPLLVEDATFIK